MRSLNPFSDIATLKHIGVRDECILTYVLSTLFVQECVEHEWTLHRMAMSMQRDVCRSDDLSDFEVLVRTVGDIVLAIVLLPRLLVTVCFVDIEACRVRLV